MPDISNGGYDPSPRRSPNPRDLGARHTNREDPMPKFDHFSSPNPLVGAYRTSDDRFVTLMLLQSDRFWPDLCEHVGRPDLIDDPRFADAGARFTNHRELIETLDDVFGSRTLAEWVEALQTLKGVWAPVQPSVRPL